MTIASLDPVSIAETLVEKLATYIAQAVQDGAKSEREATHKALQRLADEHKLAPILPTIEADLAAARRPAAERDTDPAPAEHDESRAADATRKT